MPKKQPEKIKIGNIRLTEHELEVLAVGMDSEFFKIISTKIIPKRLIQLSLTNLSASQDTRDLYFYKGRYAEATWLKSFLSEKTKNIEAESPDDEIVD